MKISTKGRYALRVVIALARSQSDEYIPLHMLSERENISEKYLESILGILVRAKLLDGARGKGGGYRLNCNPKECTVWDILSLTETSVAPVSCLVDDVNTCDRVSTCVTLPVWKELNKIIRDYLNSVTLDQFLRHMPLVGESVPDGDWHCGL